MTGAFQAAAGEIRYSGRVSSLRGGGVGVKGGREAFEAALESLRLQGKLNPYESFYSPDDAAKSVLNTIAELSEWYGLEAMGHIKSSYLRTGRQIFHYTLPQVGGEGSGALTTDCVGYHTHPGGDLMFSNRQSNWSQDARGGDSSWVESAGKDLYLGVFNGAGASIGVCSPGACAHMGTLGTSPTRAIQ